MDIRCPRCGERVPVANTCDVCKRTNMDNLCMSHGKKARSLGFTYPNNICVDCIQQPVAVLRQIHGGK